MPAGRSKQAVEFPVEPAPAGAGSGGLQVDDHVHRGQHVPADLLAIVLTHSPAKAVSHHGATHAPTGREPEPGVAGLVFPDVEHRDVAMETPTPTVDPAIVATRPDPFDSRCDTGVAPRAARSTQGQTVRRLRPFRRRRERIARPCLVRIRARKPCFFLRRRLFGWYVLFTLLPC